MKDILVVANDFPYPPNHGAALDMWSRILVLLDLGYYVDVVATVRKLPTETEVAAVREKVRHLWLIPRKLGLKQHLSLQPFQVSSRIDLQRIRLSQRYDAVILEADHVGAFLGNPATRNAKLILRIHNDEHRYFRELASGKKSGWKKLFYYAESLKFRLFSKRVRSACDALLFISEHERDEHLRHYPEDQPRCFFLPPDVRPSELRPFSGRGKTVLFVGTLTIPHNKDAVSWYVDNVHPLLAEMSGYTLVIAGRTGGEPIEHLKQLLEQHRNCTLNEDPDDLNELYENAAVFVNPVLRGAGVKLKVLHALQAGIPVVSTSVGVEGTGLRDSEHVLIADTPQEFAECVRRVMSDANLARHLVDGAQKFLLKTFDMQRNLERIMPVILG